MLELQGLSKSFGALQAVGDLSLVAETGLVTSIIGPNGAGKSTVFNLISGALRPEAGRVLLDGRDITGMTPFALSHLGLARSFQITNLFFGLSVHENARLACQMREPRRRYLTSLAKFSRPSERAWTLLEEFGLAESAQVAVGELSHGDQRRLEIAVCMASAPRVLLLDEPTQGMSPSETADIDRLIKSLAGRVTIVLIEHDIDLVMNISDKVVVMHQGKKLFEGAPEEVRADPAVRDAYLGYEHGAA